MIRGTTVAAAALAAALLLGGCTKKEATTEAPAAGNFLLQHNGRYLGVGIYSPNTMWKQLARDARPADPAASRLEDDEQVIVVVDSRTGEVRQCGNLSGYCVSMNPWSGRPGPKQAAPVPLVKHSAELEQEANAPAQSPAAAAPSH